MAAIRKTFHCLLFTGGLAAAVYLPIHYTNHPYDAKSFVPHLLGIIGTAMMASGAIFYVLRKRIKALRNFGRMKLWLDAHIVFCLIGPLLIVYHSALNVLAPNSAVALYVTLTIVASGVVGRYIYRHFQFSLSGERSGLKEMVEQAGHMDEEIKRRFVNSENILESISRFFGLREKHRSGGILSSLYLLIRLDLTERRLKRQIKPFLSGAGQRVRPGARIDQASLEAVVLQRIKLERKISTLEAALKLFSFWHKLHVPLVWILILTFIIHIAAVLVF